MLSEEHGVEDVFRAQVVVGGVEHRPDPAFSSIERKNAYFGDAADADGSVVYEDGLVVEGGVAADVPVGSADQESYRGLLIEPAPGLENFVLGAGEACREQGDEPAVVVGPYVGVAQGLYGNRQTAARRRAST